MDRGKILFITSLSKNINHMIRRAFHLAHSYHAPLEIYHIVNPDERSTDTELKALIELSIEKYRNSFHKHHTYEITISRGDFFSQINDRINVNDYIFLIAEFPKNVSLSIEPYQEFFTTIQEKNIDTFLYNYDMEFKPMKVFNYTMQMSLIDLRVIGKLISISKKLELSFVCHYFDDSTGTNKLQIKDIENAFGSKLKRDEVSINFRGHTSFEQFEVSNKSKETLVITKNHPIDLSDDLLQYRNAVIL